MAQQTKPRKTADHPMPRITEVPADKVRACLGDLLDRSGFRGERIAITRHGKRIAVLISVDDLETLEAVA